MRILFHLDELHTDVRCCRATGRRGLNRDFHSLIFGIVMLPISTVHHLYSFLYNLLYNNSFISLLLFSLSRQLSAGGL